MSVSRRIVWSARVIRNAREFHFCGLERERDASAKRWARADYDWAVTEVFIVDVLPSKYVS